MIETNPRNRSTGVKGITYSPKFSKKTPFIPFTDRNNTQVSSTVFADPIIYPWGGDRVEIANTISKCEAILLRAVFESDPLYYEQVWLNKPVLPKKGNRGPLTRTDFPAELLEMIV
jgi:hypothetical protein